MSIGGKKAKRGSVGTSIIVEKIPGLKRITCSNCTYYNSDNSCSAKPVLISEIGYDYWKQCNSFSLNDKYDSEENREIVQRNRKIKSRKKNKNKNNRNENYNLNVNKNNKIERTSIRSGGYEFMETIYPTEKSSGEFTYAKRGKSREERLSEERVKKHIEQRDKLKLVEDKKKYNELMYKIGKREKLESLYINHFKGTIDTLDFIDKIDNLIKDKDISETDLIFIREYLYKKLNK